MPRNYSDELDRNVREVLFARFISRVNQIQTRKKTPAMLTELTEQISKLTEAVEVLTKELGAVLQPDVPQPMPETSTLVAETRSEVVETINIQATRVANVVESVRILRDRLDVPTV